MLFLVRKEFKGRYSKRDVVKCSDNGDGEKRGRTAAASARTAMAIMVSLIVHGCSFMNKASNENRVKLMKCTNGGHGG
ncbi:MAG: hypothetical protein LBV36_00975 [Chromatiales bacterium]|jgi:hypothetical protein|nr:hypothetical protein [Chromatiales bacterium]